MCFTIRKGNFVPKARHGYKIVVLTREHRYLTQCRSVMMGTPVFTSLIKNGPHRWCLGHTVPRDFSMATTEKIRSKRVSLSGIYVWTKRGMRVNDHFNSRNKGEYFMLMPGEALIEVEVEPNRFLHESVDRGVRTYTSAKMTKVVAFCPTHSRYKFDSEPYMRRRGKQVPFSLLR